MSEMALESVLRRDRFVVVGALGAVILLAWAYIIYLAIQMNKGGGDMSGFRMAATAAGMVMRPASQPWSGTEFAFTFAMWAVMMIGMMTPSAAPIILLYARVERQAAVQGKPIASAAWFLSGYLVAWVAFSLAATAAQWGLDRAALLTPTMAAASAALGGIVLSAAGIYQWTALKDRCLMHCQSPLQFLQHLGGFPRSVIGSLKIGMSHGTYCVGCCWAVMTLLFVGGVMNVLWISIIAILVLAERVIPAGRLIPRLAGVIFALAGFWLIAR